MKSMTAALVTVADACVALSITRPTLYSLMAKGALRSVKIGRARRIPTSEIERIAGGRAPRPQGPPASPPWQRDREAPSPKGST